MARWVEVFGAVINTDVDCAVGGAGGVSAGLALLGKLDVGDGGDGVVAAGVGEPGEGVGGGFVFAGDV